jgi:hypothetical protein
MLAHARLAGLRRSLLLGTRAGDRQRMANPARRVRAHRARPQRVDLADPSPGPLVAVESDRARPSVPGLDWTGMSYGGRDVAVTGALDTRSNRDGSTQEAEMRTPPDETIAQVNSINDTRGTWRSISGTTPRSTTRWSSVWRTPTAKAGSRTVSTNGSGSSLRWAWPSGPEPRRQSSEPSPGRSITVPRSR